MLPKSVQRVATVLAVLATLAITACGGGGGGGTTAVPPAAQNTPPSFSGPIAFAFDENIAVDFVLTVTDPDSATVTISDDNQGDGALFTVDASSGRVTANTPNGAFDFENPQDADSDNVYEQLVTLSDGTNTVNQTISVTINPVDEGPEFNNEPSVELNENDTGALVTFVATDPETGTVSTDYEIVQVDKIGEVVNAQRLLDAFEIDPATGTLSVVIPFDADTEGTQPINVLVRASDGQIASESSVSIQLIDLPARVVSGIQIQGRSTLSQLGESAFLIDDIDADGLPEVWVSERVDETGLETAYLIWGSTLRDEMQDGFGDLTIDALTPEQALRFVNDDRTQTERRSLMLAQSAGDVDGDGFADLLIGFEELRDSFSFEDAPDGPLAVVVWGDQLQNVAGGEVALQALDATDGIALAGLSRQESVMLGVASGDIDNDGRADLFFGHPAIGEAKVVYGAALTKGNATFDIGAAASDQVVRIQSETPASVRQQIGNEINVVSDIDEDGIDEVVIGGLGLEPDLQDGIYIVSGAVLNAAKATGTVNLLDDAVAPDVVEMLGRDAAIVGLSTAGDIDNDGLDDIALAHVGNVENDLVATVVFGATIRSALATSSDPSLQFSVPAEGINVRIDGQIFTQSTEARVTATIVDSVGGGAGHDLMIGLGEDSPLGRENAGSIAIITDSAIVAATDAVIRFPVDAFPSDLGRQFAGTTTNAGLGGQPFVADFDGDGLPDLSMASVTAGPADNGFTRGAFLFLPGTFISTAFGADEPLSDMASALSNELPLE